MINLENSIMAKTDSYKLSHFLQFPPNTQRTFYYIESRSENEEIKFFGLQAVLKKHFMNVPTRVEVEEMADFAKQHGLPFNIEGWKLISRLGYLPIKIKAVPEGTVLPTKNVIITVENTDDRFFWLPGYIETMLMQIWYPITVCTRSYNCKKVILKYLEETGTPETVDFKLHDFGFRGVSSHESAGLGDMAHLVNFKGTDTIAGILAAQKYYNTNEMVGFSIPAAEHSTMTAWTKDGETAAYENMLNQFGARNHLVAVVSDSYDLTNAVNNIWGGELRNKVLKSGATIIIRPDSGNPAEIVLRTVKQLDKVFGTTMNSKGYKVLNPAIRIIQGDGMSGEEAIEDVLDDLTGIAGYSADNIAFGMGGGLLQQVNRDTYKFAMKCSAAKVDGVWRDVFKEPADCPWKKSKAGMLTLSPEYKTYNIKYYSGPSALQTVFDNGALLVDETFETVRNR
jgi:nicotinamide phosphoribosyltransferase